MAGPFIESARSPELAAVVALLDRPVLVARPRTPLPIDLESEALAEALAEATIVAASRPSLGRGAVPGGTLGERVTANALREELATGSSGSPLTLVVDEGLVEMVIYQERVPMLEETAAAVHREARRWAHDLANSFMTVTGHAQLLRRHVSDADATGQRSIDRIIEAVESASQRIKERVRSLGRPSE